MPLADEEFLDEPQLAVRLCVSPRTLSWWRGKGIGPTYVRIGRKIVYPLGPLEEWLASRTTSNRSTGAA